MIHQRVIAGLIRKEFRQIFRDRKMLVALFFLPIMQLVMFGLALTSEVKNIQMVVVAKPSAMAREIETRALASGWFRRVEQVDGANVADPAQLLISGRAEAVLVAPARGLEYALERQEEPVQLLINATNAQRAQQVNAYIQQILARVAARRGYQLAGPEYIRLQTRILFNHYLDTTNFMVPALLVMASFIVLMTVCAMSITKEKEMGTMEKLISSPASTADILLGKTLPYCILGICIIAAMLTVGMAGFGIVYRGTLWQLALNGAAHIACALALATLLSTIAHTQQQALMGGILFLLPGILLSGVFFPVANIPVYFRWICYINPLTYACMNFRNIILKGGDYPLFWLYFFILAAMAAALSASAYKNFKAKLN